MKTMKPTAALLASCLLAGTLGACGTPQRHSFEHAQMGTQFRIVLYAHRPAAAEAAARAAFDRIDTLNAIMSDYDPNSELSRLSRTSADGPGRPTPVSDDLFAVLQSAQHWSQRSHGAFDVTVGPIVRLWRQARHRRRLPREQRLADALAATGYQKMRLEPDAHRVTLLAKDMRLDLGGIAKGYAADEALKVLRAHGIHRALIDAGGDVTLGDRPPDEPGWRVALRHGADQAATRRVLIGDNVSVATSGDAFRFVEIDGVRYSHIVDPKTGLGLTDSAGVTVIAPRGADADALASALSVLGPEAGIRLVDSVPGAAALITRRRADGSLEHFESARIRSLHLIDAPGP